MLKSTLSESDRVEFNPEICSRGGGYDESKIVEVLCVVCVVCVCVLCALVVCVCVVCVCVSSGSTSDLQLGRLDAVSWIFACAFYTVITLVSRPRR